MTDQETFNYVDESDELVSKLSALSISLENLIDDLDCAGASESEVAVYGPTLSSMIVLIRMQHAELEKYEAARAASTRVSKLGSAT